MVWEERGGEKGSVETKKNLRNRIIEATAGMGRVKVTLESGLVTC